MESRNFKLDTEWNIIHYPYKPNGFGILILGDERQFVERKSSFWTQNEGKKALLREFKEAGYTVFYSNLYGMNWGSQKAVELAGRLCSHVQRNEILNDKIHVFAEGMGALTAINLLKLKKNIRSLVMLNPILSLKQHLEQEKEHKFFYKKLLHEVSTSYHIRPEEVSKLFTNKDDFPYLPKELPSKIIHVLASRRSYQQSELFKEYYQKWEKEEIPISICYMVPEKKSQIGPKAINFFKQHEHVL
ncbi:hydrolase [Bacillus sp. B15-48]|uniref:hydrolase n=1 Tax=Bacillus sp. B15-48 TaxID=1548601 RepID=UPI00193FF212|nr:hydrolase [Bacillus sp. B15-48]MBM4764238.1 hydrolase [Bacillus sp. B15-48]